MNENKVSAETIIRTIILAVTLVNQVLTATGKNPLPFSEETLYSFLSVAATVIVSVWAWWKNNSFTQAAIEADKVYEFIKNAEVLKEPPSDAEEIE